METVSLVIGGILTVIGLGSGAWTVIQNLEDILSFNVDVLQENILQIVVSGILIVLGLIVMAVGLFL